MNQSDDLPLYWKAVRIQNRCDLARKETNAVRAMLAPWPKLLWIFNFMIGNWADRSIAEAEHRAKQILEAKDGQTRKGSR